MGAEPSLDGFLQALYAAGDYLTPDYYSRNGTYAPEQWSEWYERSQTFGTPEFVKHQDFIAKATPRYQKRLEEFLQYAEARQQNDPGYGEGWGIFWDEFYGPMVEDAAQRKVMGQPLTPDVAAAPEVVQATENFVGDFFNWMRETSIAGDERPDTSVTPEQMEEWRNDPDFGNRMQSEWRMTPEGQAAYAKLLDYNFLNAFQEGYHRPEPLHSQMLGSIGGIMGAMQEGMAYGANAGEAGTQLGQAQVGLVNNPTPGNALTYVNEVDRFAETQDPEFYNSWLMGSAAPQMSLMTGTGLDLKTFSGNTPYGQATRNMTNAVMMNNFSRRERGDFDQFMNLNDRWTPIRPAGMGEESEQLAARGRQLETDNWRQVSAYTPRWIRYLNSMIAAPPQTWGGETPPATAGMKVDPRNAWVGPALTPMSDKEREYEDWRVSQGGTPQPQPDPDPYAKVGITPFVPSAFVNDAAMIVPGIVGDPANAVSTAIIGPTAAGLSYRAGAGPVGSYVNALRAMTANNVGDFPGEMGFSAGISLTQTPQTPLEYFTQPDPNNPIRTSTGEVPAADTKEYMDALEKFDQDRQDTVTSTQNVLRKQLKGVRKTPRGRAVTRPSRPRP
jgi:hypothetical protein